MSRLLSRKTYLITSDDFPVYVADVERKNKCLSYKEFESVCLSPVLKTAPKWIGLYVIKRYADRTIKHGLIERLYQ